MPQKGSEEAIACLLPLDEAGDVRVAMGARYANGQVDFEGVMENLSAVYLRSDVFLWAAVLWAGC